MARFMDVHNGFVGATAEQLREAHQLTLAWRNWTPAACPRADQLLGEQSR